VTRNVAFARAVADHDRPEDPIATAVARHARRQSLFAGGLGTAPDGDRGVLAELRGSEGRRRFSKDSSKESPTRAARAFSRFDRRAGSFRHQDALSLDDRRNPNLPAIHAV